jgi:hypothetical protein
MVIQKYGLRKRPHQFDHRSPKFLARMKTSSAAVLIGSTSKSCDRMDSLREPTLKDQSFATQPMKGQYI